VKKVFAPQDVAFIGQMSFYTVLSLLGSEHVHELLFASVQLRSLQHVSFSYLLVKSCPAFPL